MTSNDRSSLTSYWLPLLVALLVCVPAVAFSQAGDGTRAEEGEDTEAEASGEDEAEAGEEGGEPAAETEDPAFDGLLPIPEGEPAAGFGEGADERASTTQVLFDPAAQRLLELLEERVESRSGFEFDLERFDPLQPRAATWFESESPADVILVTTRPLDRDAITDALTDLGRAPQAAILATDVVTVFINENYQSGVREITLDTIREIFSGRIEDWSTLAGAAREMNRYLPAEGTDTWIFLADLLAAATPPLTITEDHRSFPSAEESAELIATGRTEDLDAIGIGSLSFAFGSSIRAYAVPIVPRGARTGTPGISPSAELDLDAEPTYPLLRPIFAYTLGEPSEAARALISEALDSAVAQQIRDRHYIPARGQLR